MHCYGSSPIPRIPELRKTLPARLGEASPPPLPSLSSLSSFPLPSAWVAGASIIPFSFPP